CFEIAVPEFDHKDAMIARAGLRTYARLPPSFLCRCNSIARSRALPGSLCWPTLVVRLSSTVPGRAIEGSSSHGTDGNGSLPGEVVLDPNAAMDAAFVANAGTVPTVGLVSSAGPFLGTIQSGLIAMHSATGLPWWASLVVATVTVRVGMLPTVWFTARHVERFVGALPEIRSLRGMLGKALQALPPGDSMGRLGKIRMFFRGTRGIMGLHRCSPMGMVAAPFVNTPIFMAFVWATRGMMKSGEVAGLGEGGVLWFSDLTTSDSTGVLPFLAVGCTYLSTEISFGSNLEGWRKTLKDVCQTIVVGCLPLVATLPQGVFMYWITSSLFTSGQALAMRDPGVRGMLGLKPLPSLPKPEPAGRARSSKTGGGQEVHGGAKARVVGTGTRTGLGGPGGHR
ncbi:unnamed protein product, partial [Discosporangium mesarthrocarpum]